MMPDKKHEIVSIKTKSETALDVASFVSSAVPWIGGPVSNVLSGISFGRKLSRVRELLEGLTVDLQDFKSQVSEEYVKTEEFEELLEKTLRMVAEERNEEKRGIFRAFLTDTIMAPGKPYDGQLRFLRTLEELQNEHIRIIRAIMEKPKDTDAPFGSPGQTLSQRLPDIQRDRIEDLVSQLNDLRITDLTTMHVTMSGRSAEDLRHYITPYGQRFVNFIIKD
jgi:hypothetical protein